MQIGINKDIEKEYAYKPAFGFTYKQLLCAGGSIALVCGIGLLSYFKLGMPPQAGVLVGIPFAAPVLLVGFKDFDGLTFLQYAREMRYTRQTRLLLYKTGNDFKNENVHIKKNAPKENLSMKTTRTSLITVVLLSVICLLLAVICGQLALSGSSSEAAVQESGTAASEEASEQAAEPEEAETEQEAADASAVDGAAAFPLSEGSEGEEVLLLQQALYLLGFTSVEATGSYDSGTATAVMGLQYAYELEITGEVDEELYEIILGASADTDGSGGEEESQEAASSSAEAGGDGGEEE